jgi:hypothetical protein
VRSATSMPSLRSSPWMRGAPQREFAVAIPVIKALMSERVVGRPPAERPESLVQYSRKRRRCHRRTVSGVTITRGCFHPVQTLANPTRRDDQFYVVAGGSPFACRPELLAQGKVLEGELTVAADEEGEEPEQVEEEGDHRVEIVSGPELRDERLARWVDDLRTYLGFGEGHAPSRV